MSQTVDLEALVDFLAQARRETYAIPEGDRNQDGTSQNAWRRDAWRYVDRYAGTNPYGGQELVWHAGRVVWMMGYRAEILADEPSSDDIYAFQRRVLGDPDPEHLMRGPRRYTHGAFSYDNRVEGGIAGFSGREHIRYADTLVYLMAFHGGVIGF